ncbi:hypothetical protein PspLS_08080 [Pyricularia sp. CBS 133598]|nr:hypothetical protein PspLS_08080 [Pyricularia sp. CBS 133598]
MQIKTVFIVFMATLVSAAAVPGGTVTLEARKAADVQGAADAKAAPDAKAGANNKNKGKGGAVKTKDDGKAKNDGKGKGNDGKGKGGAGGNKGKNGADFGKCKPLMDFQKGRKGRKATEGTFLPTDALVAKGQQDALNPNIITNEICNQLTNVCGANTEAKTQCAAAKAMVASLGTKDASTAAAFNKALGF